MRRVLLACLLAACGHEGGGSPPTGPITAHVTHYDYTFDMDTRAAHSKLTLVVDKAGDCLTLPQRAQDLANVTLDGMVASKVTSDASSMTACGAGWQAGATLTLDADVTVPLATLSDSQVGYSLTKDNQGNTLSYLLSWVGECDRFGPCDHRPDQFATYHFDVTHAAGTTVLCPGTVTDVSPTETTCAFDKDGGPTYSTFAVMGFTGWTKTDEGTWGDAHVTLYDSPGTGIAAAIDPSYHAAFMTWLISMFGPFPYGDLRVATGPTYWNGFEHPGNILLADSLIKQHGTYEVAHDLDHEIVHQWGGDQTTLADTYDFTWKEAMSEYLTYVWEDMQDESWAQYTLGAWKTDGMAARHFPVPEGNPRPALFDYYGDAYGPGPMILFRQLEVLTSRQQVLAAIASVLGHQHALSMDDLVAALAAHTGLDLADYEAAWIDGTGEPTWPRFDITFTAAPGTSTLVVHQVNATSPLRACAFHVALHGATPDEVATVAVDTFHGGPDQTLSVETPAFTVTSIEMDPQKECMAFLDSSTPRTAPVTPWVSAFGRGPRVKREAW